MPPHYPPEHRPLHLAQTVPFDSISAWDSAVIRSNYRYRFLICGLYALFAFLPLMWIYTKRDIYLYMFCGYSLIIILVMLWFTINTWIKFLREQEGGDEEEGLRKGGEGLKNSLVRGGNGKEEDLRIVKEVDKTKREEMDATRDVKSD